MSLIEVKRRHENNRHHPIQDIANILKISKPRVSHYDGTVPTEIKLQNQLDRIYACYSLLKRNANILFLKQILMSHIKLNT